MALQLARGVMICERYVAVGAPRNPCALAASGQRGISAPVLEEYYLRTFLKGIPGQTDGFCGERAFYSLGTTGGVHVDNAYLRQGCVAETCGKLHEAEFIVFRLVIGFDRRGGRPQECFRPVHLCKHHRHIASVISRCGVVLFVAAFMLFVHNHQAEVGEGEEYCGSCPDYHERIGRGKQATPYVHSFAVGEFRVVDDYARAEHFLESSGQLGGRGDFWNKHQRLIATLEHKIYKVDVNFSFAARSNAMQQCYIVSMPGLVNGIEGLPAGHR